MIPHVEAQKWTDFPRKSRSIPCFDSWYITFYIIEAHTVEYLGKKSQHGTMLRPGFPITSFTIFRVQTPMEWGLSVSGASVCLWISESLSFRHNELNLIDCDKSCDIRIIWYHSTLPTRLNDSTSLVTSVKASIWFWPRTAEMRYENYAWFWSTQLLQL